ncbi:MAG: 50S ribosomal protein L25 [Bacteroidales bacterium]|nr:50S ribosomal protein L25 [Bacteroidales bacterium]
MKHYEICGQLREVGNKATIKACRAQGLVPCNLYGLGMENVLFTVTEKDINALLSNPASFIIDVVLGDKKQTAVVHELQFHPVSDKCLHVDFLAVNEEKPIAIDIPVAISGHAAGVQKGGKFVQKMRKIRVCGLMSALTDELPIDITALEIGQNIVAGDLKYDGLTVLTQKDTIVCGVKATRNSSK